VVRLAGKAIKISVLAKVTEAVAALRAVAEEAKRTNKKLSDLNSGVKGLSSTTNVFGLVTKLAASRMGLWAIAIGASIPAVVGLVRALAPLAGLAAAVPSGLLAGVSVLAAFKIAISGVSDAISVGLSGDLESYTKKLALIPPAARTFVQAVVGMRQSIQNLRQSVASAFFTPFAHQLSSLASKVLPVLRVGLSAVAGGLGRIVSILGKVAGSTVFMKALTNTFTVTTRSLDLAGPAIGRLATALLRLVSVGSGSLPTLVNGVAKAVDVFSRWLTVVSKSGKLKGWLNDGLTALKQVYRITSNVGSILRTIFTVGAKGGSTLLSTWVRMTAKFNAFLKSARGQQDLRTLFDGLRTVGKQFLSFLEQAAPVARDVFLAVQPALPVLGQISRQIIQDVLPAIREIALVLQRHRDLVKGLAAVFITVWGVGKLKLFADGLFGLIGTVGKVVGAAKTLRAAWLGVAVAEGIADAANPIGAAILLIAAAAAIGFALGALAAKFDIFRRGWHAWQDAIGRSDLQAKFNTLIDGIKSLWHRVSSFFENLPEALRLVGVHLIDGFVNGIKSKFREVKDTLTNLGDSALGWLKDKLGIASPSRKFAALGSFSLQGYIAGLRDKMPALRSALAGVNQELTLGPRGGNLDITRAPAKVDVHVHPGGNLAEAGREVVKAVRAHERQAGVRILAAT
jgi:hypothetical protein